jgi:hypothetical protein
MVAFGGVIVTRPFVPTAANLPTGNASASTFFCGKRDAPIREGGFSDAYALGSAVVAADEPTEPVKADKNGCVSAANR